MQALKNLTRLSCTPQKNAAGLALRCASCQPHTTALYPQTMKTKPVLENEFYHDGRGPELQQTIWGFRDAQLIGFTFYNPDDTHDDNSLKHIKLEKVEAYMMAGEEVHPNIMYSKDSKAAIFEVVDSPWLKQFDSPHVADCKHFQISFYDEIYDVICKSIIAGKGQLNKEKV